jgi:hypothetical protein
MEETDYYYDLPQENVLEETAPFIRRLAAFIIDMLVFNILFYSPFIQAFQLTSGIYGGLLTVEYLLANTEIVGIMFGVLLAATVIFCFYMALSEYVFGKTIGKHLLGIWVQGKTSLLGFVARNFLKSTLIIFLPLDLIGLLTRNQRLIDQALGVNVLYVKRIPLTEGFV